MELVGQRIGNVRIEDVIGQGGMGVVYRGFDEVLERRVAVKVIGDHQSWSDDTRARFRREARAMARFQHPNVCQVHAYVEGDNADYIIIEYLDGMTLGDTVAQRRLTMDETLAICEQIARALAAADQAGLVHRDLKPDNVMVLADGTVKLLDFGLARPVDSAARPRPAEPATSGFTRTVMDHPLSSSVSDLGPPRPPDQSRDNAGERPPGRHGDSFTTVPGTLAGTLRYMSPEQARGGELSPASDVFALGIILRELASGHPAYPTEIEWPELLDAVSDGRTLPLDGLDPDLAGLIAALTALAPTDRPPARRVVEVLRALRERPLRLARRRRWFAAATIAAVALAAAMALTYRMARPPAWLPAGERGAVALLPFVNATGRDADVWVEGGLQAMVARAVGQRASFDVVPPADVARAAANLGLTRRSRLGDDEARSLTHALGATVVVAVEIGRDGERLRADLRAYNRDGSVGRQRITSEEPTALVRAIAGWLRQRLAPGGVDDPTGTTLSEDLFANRAYAIASDTMERGDARRAQLYFQVCLDRDPGFLMAMLGQSACAEKLLAWDEAVRFAIGALQTARTRHDREVEGESLLRLGTIAFMRGDFTQANEHLRAALAIAVERTDRRMQSRCRNDLGRAALRQNHFADAERHFTEAEKIATATGDRRGQAIALTNLGMVQWQRGELAMAGDLFTRALAVNREVHDRSGQLACLVNLGGLAASANRLPEAEQAFTTALPLARELGDRNGEMTALTNLGVVAFLRGELAVARQHWEEVLAIRRAVRDRPGQAKVLNNLCQLATREHRWDEGARLCGEALAIRRELKDPRGQALVLINVGELARRRGHLGEAEKTFVQARQLAVQTADRPTISDAAVGLGNLAIDRHAAGEGRRWLAVAREARGDNESALLLDARIAYETGDFRRAADVQAAAKTRLAQAWDTESETLLTTYRTAASTGRRQPLPK